MTRRKLLQLAAVAPVVPKDVVPGPSPSDTAAVFMGWIRRDAQEAFRRACTVYTVTYRWTRESQMTHAICFGSEP